ncbi:MAG TPA: hypothetical protein VFT99_07085, partial [Roseiflexaceae bacterium]|nr:hypothetical protein [Roseiflexaceae bacterium]
SGGGYFARHPHAPPTLYASRPLLEAEVRRRVLALPNVELCSGCNILGFESSTDKLAVTGIRVQPHDQAEDRVMHADLVVDATGRGSRTPAWLEAIGYQKPLLELVEVDMGYASRLYERQPGDLCGDLMINIAPTPHNRRACGMLAQEGNRWLVTLAGYFGDHPPTDVDGFLAFAHKLPTGDVYDLIRSARPLGDVVQYRFMANQRRRYEWLQSFPQGLLVIGDALCSFTPIYGQGMSVAAMQAMELRACLRHAQPGLARRYFKNVAALIDNPWSLTVGNDQRLAAAPQPLARQALNWYMGRFQRAARYDSELALAFGRVGNLVAPPTSLLHPRLAVRVFAARA